MAGRNQNSSKPPSGSSRGGGSSKGKGGGDASFMDSDFILLDDLVYAPLHALAESNQNLRAHIVEAIKDMSSVRQNGQEEVIHLDNINIAYDQVRQEGEEGYSIDNLQLQVPLLSVVPVTNLSIEKADIDFATEVRSDTDAEGKVKISGRICSPEQRESNFLPRVSYHMEIKSIPATEGIMRLTDLLSANQMAKQLDSTPITVEGNLRTDEQKSMWQEISDSKMKIKKLRQLYQKVADTLDEQEKLYQISKDAYEADTYEFDRNKYLKTQSDIMNQIMKEQEKIIDLEIKNGMSEANE